MKKENKVRCPVCGAWNAKLIMMVPLGTTYNIELTEQIMEIINQIKVVQMPCKKCKYIISA